MNLEKINNIINYIKSYNLEVVNLDWWYISWIEKRIQEECWWQVKAIIYKSLDKEQPWYYIKTLSNSNKYGDQESLPKEWLNNKIPWLKFIHNWRFIALFDNLENLNQALLKFNYIK
jgi:hypothetical protein